ncbi:MAG: hypothetical protein ACYDBQ_03510 [Thermoplasmatota archaeon]
MAKNELVVIGVLGLGGLAAWYFLGRNAGAASASGADQSAAYPYADPYGGGGGYTTGGLSYPTLPGGTPGTPDSGAPPPGTGGGGGAPGAPGAAAPPPVINLRLSPPAEQQLLNQNQDLNRQSADTNRFSQGIQAAAATAAAAPFAIYGAYKYGSALASAFRGAGQAAAGAVENIGARLAAPGAGFADVAALTPAGAAVGVAGGVGLGLAGVAALKQTGALAAGSRFEQNVFEQQPGWAKTTERAVLSPLSAVGAVATGLVGYGSVGSNLGAVWHGIFG